MECSLCFTSLVRFVWVSGPFWAKKTVFGHKMHNFGRAHVDLPPLPRGATVGLLAQNLDLTRAPPRL